MRGPRYYIIDIETRSPRSIDYGVTAQVSDPKSGILWAAIEESKGREKQLFNTYTGPLDLVNWFDRIRKTEDQPIFVAHNAHFEITFIREHLRRYGASKKLRKWACDPIRWRCTQAMALSVWGPADLEHAAAEFCATERKDAQGKRLIRKFSIEYENPDKNYGDFRLFGDYCAQDVKVEKELFKTLAKRFPHMLRDDMWARWREIEYLNTYGAPVDHDLCCAAATWAQALRKNAAEDIARITEVSNPYSDVQLGVWLIENGLQGRHSTATGRLALGTSDIEHYLSMDQPKRVRKALEARAGLKNVSFLKYEKVLGMEVNGRIYDYMRWHGAHTGRLSSQMFQGQNLPNIRLDYESESRNRELIDLARIDLIADLKTTVPKMKALTRAIIRPDNDHTLYIGDFAQVEARLAAWIAGEDWVVQAFAEGRDVYSETAARMFGCELDEVDKKKRQIGKVCVLALGYGSGEAGLDAMAQQYGVDLTLPEREDLKDRWRRANPKIKAFWKKLQSAISMVIAGPSAIQQVGPLTVGLNFTGDLWIELPSGRRLWYRDVKLDHDGEVLVRGIHAYNRTPGKVRMWGGTFFENVCQGIVADLMDRIMRPLREAGYRPILQVHDELVCEAKGGTVEEFHSILASLPEWLPGFPLAAECFSHHFYCK